ncbi:MAG: nucleotidyltransferase family protein [Firmicutes bacterium]|nr:nucleotidyltransferase family protein [Bacillota bacterium]
MVNAVVLAGRANDGRLKEYGPPESEALIDIAGKPMLQYVLDALRGSRGVERIMVIGPPQILSQAVSAPGVEFLPGGDSITDHVLIASRHLAQDKPILIVTSDIPLVTTEMIDRFLEAAGGLAADFCYPIARRQDNEARYPGVKRTYVSLRDGTFTGGNIFLVNPPVIERVIKKAEEFIRYRKSPVKLAGLLGWSFVLGLALKRLNIKQLEAKVSRLFNVKARAVLCPDPEVGLDVDKPSDLELVRRVLGDR